MVRSDAAYYNDLWMHEGLFTWRLYPGCFSRIGFFVGSGKDVLDVGCGVGVLMWRLKNQGNRCIGVDISSEAIKFLEQVGMEGRVSSVPPLPFRDNSFDVVVATEMFEHVADDKELMKECRRVCRSGGFVIGAVPNDMLDTEQEDSHFRKYNIEQFRALLGTGSFVDAFVDDFQPANIKKRITIPTLLGHVKVVK